MERSCATPSTLQRGSDNESAVISDPEMSDAEVHPAHSAQGLPVWYRRHSMFVEH